MADSRHVELLRAEINGFEVMASLEGFTPPDPEKITADVKGGMFVAYKKVVGATLPDWSLTLSGASADLIKSMGVGSECEVTVYASVKGDDSSSVPVKYEMSGEVIKADKGEVKVSEDKLTLTGSPYAYTFTENNRVVHDVNAKTQKCVIGGKDLLEKARRNVGM
jgi:phage tail tube protein FII